MDHAQQAREHLEAADNRIGDALTTQTAAAEALTGIGHALLALNDTGRLIATALLGDEAHKGAIDGVPLQRIADHLADLVTAAGDGGHVAAIASHLDRIHSEAAEISRAATTAGRQRPVDF